MDCKENLKEKVNQILEQTAKKQEKYQEERKAIYTIVENIQNEKDIEILETILNMFTKMIQLEEENNQYHNIKTEFQKILQQRIRKQDKEICQESELKLFSIQSKEGKKYTFFLRENATKYIEDNPEHFSKDTEIKIVKNDNIDLEMLFLNLWQDTVAK